MAQAFCILLILLAGFLWIYVSAIAVDMGKSDAAGNAMAAGFAGLGAIALWVLLAIILLIAGAAGEMPAWCAAAAVVLLPVSGYSAVVGIDFIHHNGKPRWIALAPMVVPPIVMIFAIWTAFAAVNRLIDPRVAGISAWGLITLATPLPLGARQKRRRAIAAIPPKTAEELAAEKAACDEDYRKQRAATFASLTADSPFWQWWDFAIEDGGEFREQALSKLVGINNREEQIAKMIEPGGKRELFFMLRNLQLRPKPEIEQAIRTFLADQVKYLMPYNPEKPMPTTVVTQWYEQYFPTIRWLTENGGTCNDQLASMADAVRKYPDCPEREKFLAELDALRPV
jgi:hypothetical protein